MTFDLDKTLLDLHKLEERATSPEELEAVRIAKIALHFVLHVGEQHGFEEYLEHYKPEGSLSPVASFAVREEADTWLEAQPIPPPPCVVRIGGALYSLGFNRRREQRVLIPMPTLEELGRLVHRNSLE